MKPSHVLALALCVGSHVLTTSPLPEAPPSDADRPSGMDRV